MPFGQRQPMPAVDEQIMTAFYNQSSTVNSFGLSSAASLDSGYGEVNPFDKLAEYYDSNEVKLVPSYNNATSGHGIVPGSFDNYFQPVVNQHQESHFPSFSNSPNLVTPFQPALAPLQLYMPFPSPSISEDDRTGTGSRSSISPLQDTMVLDNDARQPPRPRWSDGSSSLKRQATDSLADVQIVVKEEPIQKTTPSRGRPRKRIPHTAVERRYRENLNSHLEKLRAAVPNLIAAQRRKSADGADPMKPSKCEVLMGAVEYIQKLEAENERLKQKKR